MKKLMLATALTLASVGAFAKGGDRMMRGLELTDAQQAQIETLVQSHRAEMQTLRSTHLDQIRALLTPEQQVSFDERMAKYKEKMEKRMNKHRS